MTRRVLIRWLLVLPSLPMVACTAFSPVTPTPMPASALRVRVMDGGTIGGPPGPVLTPGGMPLPMPTIPPRVLRGQATVRVTHPGTPKVVIAEGQTHDSDWTTIHLPPGQYWVFLPMDHQSILADPNWDWDNLPDLRTQVHAWAEATVPQDGTVDVTLLVYYRSS